MRDSMKIAAKKMAALIAASAMAVAPVAGTIGMTSVTAMAAITDTAEVSITGLKSGDTVYLYKIVEPSKNANQQWDGWKKVDEAGNTVSIDKSGANLSVDLPELVKLANASTLTADAGTVADSTGKFAKSVTPGVYLAMVIPAANDTDPVIYNPMFLSVSVDDHEAVTGATIKATDSFDTNKITNTTTTITDKAYAKSSTVTLDKVITNKDSDGATDTPASEVKGEDLQKGDTSDFKIKTKFPDYRGYTNLDTITFTLDDNQDEAFGHPSNIVVYAGTTQLAAGTDYTVTYGSYDSDAAYTATTAFSATATADTDEDFKITFTKNTLLRYPASNVTVTYSAVLNTPKIYEEKQENNVQLTYTYKNTTDTNTTTKTSKTTDYSFKVDVKKTDAADNSVLFGATFSLTRQKLIGGKLADMTADDDHALTINTQESTASGANGLVHFTGLDEGYYKIKEVTAPTKGTTKYSVNTEDFYIHVIPTWDTNHTEITGYEIKQVGEDGQEKTTGTSGSVAKESDTYTLTVTDTPVNGLPSTGARSALILTIAGVAVMVTVMAASRKKKIAE